MNRNLLIWITLAALTLAGYYFAESWLPKRSLILLLLLITSVKFLGVGFQFMELKHAHSFWKTAFLTLLTLYIGLVLSFQL